MTSSVIYYSKEQKVQHEMKLSGVTVVLYTLWRLLWSIKVKNKKVRDEVEWRDFFTRYDVFCDLFDLTPSVCCVCAVACDLFKE